MLTNKLPPKILAAPIGVVWLHAWLSLHILIFQFMGGILSLAPSSAKGYYVTNEWQIVGNNSNRLLSLSPFSIINQQANFKKIVILRPVYEE